MGTHRLPWIVVPKFAPGFLGALALLLASSACTSTSKAPVGQTTVRPEECATGTLEAAPRLTPAIAKTMVGRAVQACLVGAGGSPVSSQSFPKERTEEPGWAELVSYPQSGPSDTPPSNMPTGAGCVEDISNRLYLKLDTAWYQARNLRCSGIAQTAWSG